MRMRIFALLMAAVMTFSVAGCGVLGQDDREGGRRGSDREEQECSSGPGKDSPEQGAGAAVSGAMEFSAEEAGLQVVLYGNRKADFIIENAYVAPESGDSCSVEFSVQGQVYEVGIFNFGSPDTGFEEWIDCMLGRQTSETSYETVGYCEYSYQGEQLTIIVDMTALGIDMDLHDVTEFTVKNYTGEYRPPMLVAASDAVREGEYDDSQPEDSGEPIRYENLYYVINDEGGVTIVSGSIATEREIPDTIDGRPVTELGDDLFAYGGANLVTSVVIPDTVTRIGRNTFANCSQITSITLPANLKEIDDFAFWQCGITSITLPEGLERIGAQAFEGCPNLVSINIPEGVQSIGESAFDGCENLHSVTISGSVEKIGDYAFEGCRNLTSVTLGDGIKEIGEKAFADTAITDITIPESVKTYGEQAFRECHSLTDVTFQSGARVIGDSMFLQCENLSSVTIPDSVTEIGHSAFCQCSSLTSIMLPPNLQVLEDDVFYSSGLTSIEIPYGVTSIGIGAFDNSVRLSSVTVPDTVTEIGNYAFSFCSSLRSISLPSGVRLGEGVFSHSPTSVTYR